MGQSPHIDATPAFHLKGKVGRRQPGQADAVDFDAAGFPLHFDAGAGQLVEPLPVHLYRAVHRRHLVDDADERLQRRFDVVPRNAVGATHGGDFALGIVGCGGLAQLYIHPVALGSPHHIVHQPGRLPEADRQNAAGQRVHRSPVAHLFALAGDALHPAEGFHRSYANGLVEVDEAVDRRFAAVSRFRQNRWLP